MSVRKNRHVILILVFGFQQEYQRQLAMQQQQQQVQPLVPQPTSFGANNPFSAFAPSPTVSPPPLPQSNSFNNSYQPQAVSAAPMSSPTSTRPPKDDGRHADLAKMLANGREDGIDTFGNFGNMRL